MIRRNYQFMQNGYYSNQQQERQFYQPSLPKQAIIKQKYQEIKQLGEGSFGQAILVECLLDQKQYVIKKINLEGMSEDEKQSSINEANILQKLNHPNIIKFKEILLSKDDLRIVMEYADGCDLEKKIKNQKGKPFSEDQILDWFTQICLAIQCVHGNKILHRDIKSSNIFLTKRNYCKLGDFGVAKQLQRQYQKTDSVVGTPYYMPPEIVERQPYSFKGDIWSLGVLLYEMCALVHPFKGQNKNHLDLKIVRGKYSPISRNYSSQLRKLVENLLSLDPNNRYTINQILDLPFIKQRINTYLSDVEKVKNLLQEKIVLDQNQQVHKNIISSAQIIQKQPQQIIQPYQKLQNDILKHEGYKRQENNQIPNFQKNIRFQQIKQFDVQRQINNNKPFPNQQQQYQNQQLQKQERNISPFQGAKNPNYFQEQPFYNNENINQINQNQKNISKDHKNQKEIIHQQQNEIAAKIQTPQLQRKASYHVSDNNIKQFPLKQNLQQINVSKPHIYKIEKSPSIPLINDKNPPKPGPYQDDFLKYNEKKQNVVQHKQMNNFFESEEKKPRSKTPIKFSIIQAEISYYHPIYVAQDVPKQEKVNCREQAILTRADRLKIVKEKNDQKQKELAEFQEYKKQSLIKSKNDREQKRSSMIKDIQQKRQNRFRKDSRIQQQLQVEWVEKQKQEQESTKPKFFEQVMENEKNEVNQQVQQNTQPNEQRRFTINRKLPPLENPRKMLNKQNTHSDNIQDYNQNVEEEQDYQKMLDQLRSIIDDNQSTKENSGQKENSDQNISELCDQEEDEEKGDEDNDYVYIIPNNQYQIKEIKQEFINELGFNVYMKLQKIVLDEIKTDIEFTTQTREMKLKLIQVLAPSIELQKNFKINTFVDVIQL